MSADERSALEQQFTAIASALHNLHKQSPSVTLAKIALYMYTIVTLKAMAKQSTANNVNFALHHAKSSPDNHF
jgi:hypothetical protein